MIKESVTILDLETSGLSPSADKIIEVAAYKYEHGILIDTYETIVKFDGYLDEKIIKLTGISQLQASLGTPEEIVFKHLFELIGNSIIISYNIGFDMAFLQYTKMRLFGQTIDNDFIDALTVCRSRFNPPYRLGDMLHMFGIEYKDGHRANNDAKALINLVELLDKQKSLLKNLNKLVVVKSHKQPEWISPKAEVRYIR